MSIRKYQRNKEIRKQGKTTGGARPAMYPQSMPLAEMTKAKNQKANRKHRTPGEASLLRERQTSHYLPNARKEKSKRRPGSVSPKMDKREMRESSSRVIIKFMHHPDENSADQSPNIERGHALLAIRFLQSSQTPGFHRQQSCHTAIKAAARNSGEMHFWPFHVPGSRGWGSLLPPGSLG